MRQTLIVFVAVLTVLGMVAPAAAVSTSTNTAQDGPTCEYPLELEDATGEEITIDEEPDSVVALQPSDAQTMFEIGAEEKVVGMPVGQFTDYLDADEDLDISGDDDVTPVAEEVIDREPDVVLAANVLEGDEVIDQLRNAGLTVYVYPTEESLDGVAENVRLTGEIVGECDGAEETIEWMDERLGVVENAIENEERPLAYYAMGDGWTAGTGTFQDEILQTAGVENLGAEADVEGWQQLSSEVVVEEDPEWIVYGESWGEPPVGEAVMESTAYEQEQFVAVNDQYMSQPGPLVVLAIEEITQEVHPEAYTEADTETEGADDEDGDESTGADGVDAADDSIPGFGVPAVVVGLLTVLGVLARRP